MKNKLSISLLLILILFSASIQGQYLNQAGYEKYSVKRIFFDQQHQKTDYTILGQNEEKVFEGKTTTARNWEYSGSKICMADFSELRIPGQYKLILKNYNTHPVYFQISPGIYKKTGKMILKSFYHARASVATLEKHVGIYHRSAGHPDTAIYIHKSAASEKRPEGSTFSSPGGWYDAGDYNKYIVNSAISTFTLLHAYEMYYKQLKQVKVNIPESSNNIPDIIDETLYNLRWMISMQDPYDGGVYHKLTSKTFCGMVMPHEDELKRYVVMKTTAATLDFAATMAKASRVLKDFDTLKPLADSCKYAAEKGWKGSVKNPDVTYIQPDEIMTGQYDDKYLNDEWYWAATELYLTTNNDSYQDYNFAKQTQFKIPQWGRVNSLGLYSLLSLPENNKRYKMAADKIISLSNQYYANYRHSPMGISLK